MPPTPPTPVRVQLLSDLHLEFIEQEGPGAVNRFFDSLDPEGVDVLVLAGDITRAGRIHTDLSRFANLYGSVGADVVYVPGNHEYYGTYWWKVNKAIAKVEAEHENLHSLGVAAMRDVRGLRFVGGTLWFPKPDPDTLTAGRWGMSDFRLIADFEPWVYGANAACVKVIEAHAAEADVIVTHHLPSEQCIAREFQSSPLNPFFVHDMTPLIERDQPPLWLYGHTHAPQEHQIGKTRLICNPKGYPGERHGLHRDPFNAKLVIEVTPKARKDTP